MFNLWLLDYKNLGCKNQCTYLLVIIDENPYVKSINKKLNLSTEAVDNIVSNSWLIGRVVKEKANLNKND